MKKRGSLRTKLMIVFGLLIFAVGFTLALLAVRTARKAVTEKVDAHLIDKATDTAEILDGRINSFFQFLEGIARTPILRDTALSYQQKTVFLTKEAAFNDKIHKMNICDMNGTRYVENGQQINISDRNFFMSAAQGKSFVAEPVVSRLDGDFVIVFAVPVYDDNRTIVGVLLATVEAAALSNDISGIVVGKTGYCYIIGLTGTCVAHKDYQFAAKQINAIELAETDNSYVDVARSIKYAMETEKSEIDYYTFRNIANIASYAKINNPDASVGVLNRTGS